MNTTNSRFGSVVLDFDRKRSPSTGMSPKNGTFETDSLTSRWRMPPIARVSPSLTTNCVVAERLLMLGTLSPVVVTSGACGLFTQLEVVLVLLSIQCYVNSRDVYVRLID